MHLGVEALVSDLGVPKVALLLEQVAAGVQLFVPHHVRRVASPALRLGVPGEGDALRLTEDVLLLAINVVHRRGGVRVPREACPVGAHLDGELLVLLTPGAGGPGVREPRVVEDKGKLTTVVVPRDEGQEALHLVLKVVHVHRRLAPRRVQGPQEAPPGAREQPVTQDVCSDTRCTERVVTPSGEGVLCEDLVNIRLVEEVPQGLGESGVRQGVKHSAVEHQRDHGEEDRTLVLVGPEHHGHIGDLPTLGLVNGGRGEGGTVDGGPPWHQGQETGPGPLRCARGELLEEERGECRLEGEAAEAVNLRGAGGVTAHTVCPRLSESRGVLPRGPRDVTR
eukprot:Hpha_TRINITY_DN15648_c1_g10::TRINITY_DN15648_c1_g10_i1::g.99730::m.99730